ncbi:response regulator [Fulvivirga sediminis]|uniref:Response regulator transcription factor n=1 Tax=Fulvivirga sediminis TaxID=2803949 RepID=A0A937K2X8_9BACT|nr:response regulator transcription factor [Fulvivirga sediminis]MBL3658332.1 response regulator transcription factor [Fulvivirga sediminis]
MQKYKVLVADDHDLFREGIKTLLKKMNNVILAGEVKRGKHVVELYKEVKPDAVIMDISMPDINGIEATKEILRIDPQAKIIILSMHDDEEYIGRCLDAGVKGYVIKSESGMELRHTIELVLQGNSYFSHFAQDIVLSRLKQYRSHKHTPIEQPHITKRELQILTLISQGLTSNAIAEKLFISIRTVETHRTNIMRKLGVKNVVELINKAAELDLV